MQFNTREPIYLQVIDDIKKKIVTGKIRPGEKLPSTRTLSEEYGINANTAARIYKEMETMELCYTKRGLGTYVNESEGMVDGIKQAMADKYISRFVEEMLGLGYSFDELIEFIEKRRG
jgi:GntR family transcriptional regulator